MPETFLDESSDSILPCGCWTGKAPDTQTQEATLFVDYIGAETNFKSIWNVTGLGAGGCRECGAVEFEVGRGNEDQRAAVENDNGDGHRGRVRDATKGGLAESTTKQAKLQALRWGFCRTAKDGGRWSAGRTNGGMGTWPSEELGSRQRADGQILMAMKVP